MVCYVVAELEKMSYSVSRITAHVKKIRVTIFARPVDDLNGQLKKTNIIKNAKDLCSIYGGKDSRRLGLIAPVM